MQGLPAIYHTVYNFFYLNMKARAFFCIAGAFFCLTAGAQDFKVHVDTSKEPVHEGIYQGTMESLSTYQCPEWFRDVKFGIWAHWGPQCQPEDGDWFARRMYTEGNAQNKYQMDVKGHPSQFGFKDWINEWKAENWDPEELVNLYKEAGAKYFFALANHHDNFDLFDSKYQPWNSVNMGPKKDIIDGWEKACRKAGLYFGISVHAAHSWTWYEVSRGSDKKGVFAGVPYDGWLTKEDGVGTWWEGYDPQDLYEQRHELSKNNGEWDWNPDKVTLPDQAFCDKIYNRTVDLVNKYNPDIVYFDDTYLPLYPFSDTGLQIVAHMYNKSMAEHNGENQVVVTGKVLNDDQKKTIVWDVERGVPDKIQELPWQTCTCIGSWHYDKHVYFNDTYKSATDVVRVLVDVVSKNGNLLLSVPVKGDGTIDPTERRIVGEIGDWMKVNSESIYETRPWKVFGEGPIVDEAISKNAQVFKEGKQKYSSKDIRFNKKGDKTLYVSLLDIPDEDISVKSLGKKAGFADRKIKNISLLGSEEKLTWNQGDSELVITLPDMSCITRVPVFKVEFK